MNVKELKLLLESYPDDMEVLAGDLDAWYYDIYSLEIKRVKDGRETESKKDAKVLCLMSVNY